MINAKILGLRKELENLLHKVDGILEETAASDEHAIYEVRWNNFIEEIGRVNDPLLHALFKNAQWDLDNSALTLRWKRGMHFLKDYLETTLSVWYPHLSHQFGCDIAVRYMFV